MPGFDRTGPLGEGPMTGGGFGRCGSGRRSAYGAGAGRRSDAFGRGQGFGGRGRGRGRGRAFGYAGPSRSYGVLPDARADLGALSQQAEDLRATLKDIEARIADLHKA